ncbi:LGFP repeat-containing protein [Streptomyces rishiriensis]|uniref:LGFP repeat-containing protein n=1 Tax=Streptomyces rishiriensis TaxID=68264 RepID=UPI0037BCCE69
MGVDSLLQQARGEAIVFDGTSDAVGGQTTSADFRIITTQQQLVEALEVSVSASVRYGLASGDARMQFAEQHAVNDASVYLVMHARAENAPRHMTGARLKPEAETIYRNDPEAFRRSFGDSYIDEIYTGGALTVLYMFHTRDESSKRDLSASLRASVGGFMAGGDISASFSSTVQTAQKASDLEIKAFISGGRGVLNPTNLNETIELYRHFPDTVLNAGTPYSATVKPWAELPMPPGPTWVETLVRQDTIETCGKNVLQAIQARSQLQHILDHPQQYINPDLPALEQARRQVNAMIGQWAQAAHACNQDITKCSLEGLAFPVIPWPKRQETSDPLGSKIAEVQAHDSRAAWFVSNFAGLLDRQYDTDPHREGRWAIATQDGKPTGGVFWTPETGAHIVYGTIFARYLELDLCQGRLGYPVSDESFLDPAQFPRHEGDRISMFEHGSLWWDAQTGAVAEGVPGSDFQMVHLSPEQIRRLVRLAPPVTR